MRTRNTTPLVTTSFDTITPNTMPLNRRSLLALMAATAAAAASGDVSAQGAASKVLRISTPYNPSTLDPHTGSAGSDHVILYPMFDTLIGFDPDTLQPSVAGGSAELSGPAHAGSHHSPRHHLPRRRAAERGSRSLQS